MELAGKHWIDISNVVDAVIVCADLGDAITATDPASTQSEQCNKDSTRLRLSCSDNLLLEKIG